MLDRLGAALRSLARRELPDGRVAHAGRVRVVRPCTDHAGLLDAMFHMLREAGAGRPAAMVRLLDVLAGVASIERDPARRREIRRHVGLAAEAALRGAPDGAAKADATWRRDPALEALSYPRRRGAVTGSARERHFSRAGSRACHEATPAHRFSR